MAAAGQTTIVASTVLWMSTTKEGQRPNRKLRNFFPLNLIMKYCITNFSA